MEDQKKTFDEFIEEERKKTPEQLEQEILSDPEYPRLTPTPEMHEKLLERIRVYEAEKAKAEEEQKKNQEEVIAGLSEEDQKALRLGRELLAQQEKNSESKRRKIHSRKRRVHREWIKRSMQSAAAVLIFLIVGNTAFGEPEGVLRTMTGVLGGREQSRIDSEDTDKVLLSQEVGEETAYQEIKDEFGFDPIRIVGLPEGYYFDRMEMDKDLCNAIAFYTNGEKYISFFIQTYYIDIKSNLDMEDNKKDEYTVVKDKVNIEVKEYLIRETGEHEIFAEFTWNNISYRLVGAMNRAELEKVIDNLHFV